MISMTRHHVPLEHAATFQRQAAQAMEVLRQRDGFRSGVVGRATDDPQLWAVVTEWDDVGSLRRALSNFDVKMGAVPLLATAMDEPTAFEALVSALPDGLRERASDRAADADTAGPARGPDGGAHG